MLQKNIWHQYKLQLPYKLTEDYPDRFQSYRLALGPPNTHNYKYGATTMQSNNPLAYMRVYVCLYTYTVSFFSLGLAGTRDQFFSLHLTQ
jgi:hypothetical protein